MRVRKISAQCVLQFTPSLAAGCVLHRPVSRVIHCSELYFCSATLTEAFVCVREFSNSDFFSVPSRDGKVRGFHISTGKSPTSRKRFLCESSPLTTRSDPTGTGGTNGAESSICEPLFKPSPPRKEDLPLAARDGRETGTPMRYPVTLHCAFENGPSSCLVARLRGPIGRTLSRVPPSQNDF